MKTFLFKCIAVFFGVLCVILFLEGVMRILKPNYIPLATTTADHDEYLFPPDSSFRNKSSVPGEFDVICRLNNFGYRGKDFLREKPEGIARVFIVGDSFTFGVGAPEDQTISALVEQSLTKKGYAVEVVNAGIGHTSPIRHYKNIRDIHLQYEPDLVILLIDASDLNDDWSFERQAIFDDNGKLIRFDKTFMYGKRSLWRVLLRYSVLVKYLNNKLVKTSKKIKTLGFKGYIETKLRGKSAKSQIVNIDNFDTIEYDHYLFLRGNEKEDLIRKHWQRTAKYLREIKEMLSDNGIPFIIGIYPYGVQVSGEEWGEGRIHWGFEKGKTYSDQLAFDIVEEFARSEKTPFINATSYFKDAVARGEKGFFYAQDGHLSSKGNHLVAKAIVNSADVLNTLNDLKNAN